MKVAVVGLGFGKLHLQGLKDLNDVGLVICDTNKELLNKTALEYDITSITTSYNDILSDKIVDIITLAVPHYLHYKMIKQGLDSNKHVYCEKPLTIKLSEAKKLTKFAEEKNLHLTVGFNMRFYKQYQKAYSLINSGEIGSLIMVDCFARANARGMDGFRLLKKKAGGGCLIDSGAHRFDLLRWLIGPVCSVFARGDKYVLDKMEAEDTAIVSMKFNKGIIGTLNCSWGVYAPRWDEGMKIYGEKGTLEIWDSDLSLTWRKADGTSETYKYNVSYEDTVGLSLANFINDVKENRPIDKVKNLASLQIIEAAYQSLEEGFPVKIKNPI